MSEPKNVLYPVFELAGLPCETPGCQGVLIDHVELKTQDFFRRCTVCRDEFHRMPAKEKLAWAERMIQGALKGDQVS